MQSNAPAEFIELLLSPEDSEKLARVRELNRMAPPEYLQFLLTFAPLHPPGREINTDADEPFEL